MEIVDFESPCSVCYKWSTVKFFPIFYRLVVRPICYFISTGKLRCEPKILGFLSPRLNFDLVAYQLDRE